MSYTTKEIVIADYLPGVTGDDDGDTLDRMIVAVSAFVDSYCKRPPGYFAKVETSVAVSVRHIAALTDRMIQLPAHHPGTVTIAGIASSQFFESAKGNIYAAETDDSPNSNFPESPECGVFRPGKIYKISARWGFVDTPPEIIEATKQIVARWFSQGRGTFGQTTPDGFVIERDAPPSAKSLLANFIKNEYEIT